ncbi:MAG: SIR2 family protein [Planctomycetes bacterium]|nr:SIR2 family protein [Planctomycetota bacterium]
MENIGVQDIIEKLANKDFVVFAGTGCVQGTGIPTWKTLLKELKERCNDYKIRNRNVDKDLNESDYPSFAQRIYDFLSENGRRSEYYETIRQNMQPTECEYTSQHIKIIKCTHKIITTNYDNTFEKAYVDGFNKSNKQGLSTQSLPCLDIKKIHDGNSITYLHGRAFAEDVILKKSDYERFYPSVSKNEINSTMHTTDLLEDFLKQIWKQETMLFIGFSFSDICLLNLFQLFSLTR